MQSFQSSDLIFAHYMLVFTHLQEVAMKHRKTAEDRKVDIVEALLRLADKIGPDRLTTNDIAREVGVTQAAIFRHFPTKADLWTEVANEIAKRMQTAWAAAMLESENPGDRLRGLIAAQLAQIESCPALPTVLHSRELNVTNPALRESFGGILAQFQVHLVTCLQQMADAGLISPSVSPQDAAVLLTSLVQGIAIRWSLGARGFGLQAEGLRLLEVQLGLFGNHGGAR